MNFQTGSEVFKTTAKSIGITKENACQLLRTWVIDDDLVPNYKQKLRASLISDISWPWRIAVAFAFLVAMGIVYYFSRFRVVVSLATLLALLCMLVSCWLQSSKINDPETAEYQKTIYSVSATVPTEALNDESDLLVFPNTSIWSSHFTFRLFDSLDPTLFGANESNLSGSVYASGLLALALMTCFALAIRAHGTLVTQKLAETNEFFKQKLLTEYLKHLSERQRVNEVEFKRAMQSWLMRTFRRVEFSLEDLWRRASIIQQAHFDAMSQKSEQIKIDSSHLEMLSQLTQDAQVRLSDLGNAVKADLPPVSEQSK